MQNRTIITVGLSPAWDITCAANGLEWGDHKLLDSQTVVPAGKALNVSRALNWMGIQSTAAGLWGEEDYPALRQAMTDPGIDLQMTAVPGRTRHNITIIDSLSNREMHLRAPSGLVTKASLTQLAGDLLTLIHPDSTVVFSGALPGLEYFDQLVGIFHEIAKKGARLVLDTSGPVYSRIIHAIPLALIKPNLEELSEICRKPIPDCPDKIIEAAAPLCQQAEQVVVSRGEKGAILIRRNQAFACQAIETGAQMVHTIGGGDFLLAGLLAHLESDPACAIAAGIKAATARVRGLFPETPWPLTKESISVEMIPI